MRVRNLFPCRGNGETKKETSEENGKSIESCKESQVQEPERGSLWLQWASAISVSFALMGCGGHLGWTSPALPHLMGPDSEFPVTIYQSSWIASIYILGSMFGTLLSPLVIDRFGRKSSLLMFAVPQLIGWALIVPARSYVFLYVARFIAGMSHGGVYNGSVIYLAEIADKWVRGAFGCLLKASTNLGSLISAIMGAYLTYSQLNLASISIPIIFLCTFVFVPESPYFHLIHGREDLALETLMRLRRLERPESVKQDMETMRLAVVEGQRTGGGLRELVTRPSNRRGLWIILSLKATQQLSGQMAIIAYTQEIFGYSGSVLPPEYAAIILGVAQIAAGLASVSLVDRLGRRPLFLLSGCLASLALAVVGTFFYAKYELKADVSGITWLPIAAFVSFEIVVSLGIGTVPYIILGEIFPTNVKGPAVASAIVVGSLFAFAVGFCFQSLNAAIGIHSTFWVFALCCCSGSFWFYAITPETKGKTLEEVQELFNSKVSKDPEA